jgi:hypothetical protein
MSGLNLSKANKKSETLMKKKPTSLKKYLLILIGK